jgi:hypothetical protein
MDDDDFRTLIDVLARELRAIGAGDIADDHHYMLPETEDGEARLLDPQKRLVGMLRAFERKLLIEDRYTYDSALERMNTVLNGEGPRGAQVELARDDDREELLADLALAPRLQEVRGLVTDLVGQIWESRTPGGSLK